MGKIAIANGNDLVYWNEDNGSGGVSLQTQVPTASYYPSDSAGLIKSLGTTIAEQMTLESTFGGDSITYTFALDNSTGLGTFTASAGVFYFELTAAQTFKLLCGGDATAGSQGANHFGWYADSVSPAAAATQSSDTAPDCCWFPNQPLATYDEGQSESTSVQAVSMGGKVVSYDFSGRSDYLKTENLSYERINQASRTQFESAFWPYAKTGGEFRFHRDRSSATYTEMVLTGSTLNAPEITRSDPSLSRWSLPVTMRTYKP